jgi:hypothetical protein
MRTVASTSDKAGHLAIILKCVPQRTHLSGVSPAREDQQYGKITAAPACPTVGERSGGTLGALRPQRQPRLWRRCRGAALHHTLSSDAEEHELERRKNFPCAIIERMQLTWGDDKWRLRSSHPVRRHKRRNIDVTLRQPTSDRRPLFRQQRQARRGKI